MDFFQKSKEDVLRDLQVNADKGLTDTEVSLSREKYGKNEFSPGEKGSLFHNIIEALKEPMVFILLIAAFITIGMNVYKQLHGEQPEYTESIGILVAIALSAGIKIVMEGRSEKAFEALNSINEDVKVKALRNGEIQYVGKRDIVVGDIIKIETGDKAPADGRLIEAMQLQVDESMLTGESIAVTKDADAVIRDRKVPLAERTNMIYGGTFVTYGQGAMVVTSVGDQTEMGGIAAELKNAINKSTPLQEKLNKLAKAITTIGILVAGFIFLYELFKILQDHAFHFREVQNAFVTSIALIVASVPEGLPTIVAMTLALNIIKMAKSNALVRKLVACETIGAINVVCSDKTGTLTKNQMTVIDVWNNGELRQPSELYNRFIIENFTLNSTADIKIEGSQTQFIGNATEGALLKAFYETLCSRDPEACPHYADKNYLCEGKCYSISSAAGEFVCYNDIRNTGNIVFQYPFSSERKSMSTIVEEDGINRIYTKGSPEKIISLCSKIIINNRVQDFPEHLKEKVTAQITEFQKEAKRVLGFAHKDIGSHDREWSEVQHEIEADLIFDGFVSIADPLREDVYEAVRKCGKSGIGLKILTGDNVVTATSIAKQLNIVDRDSIILEAQAIDEMSDEELIKIIDKIVVIARSKPATKLRIVNLLKKLGNVVAVTGDGINDAPALKNADVGIAMGITGTEVSKEASDIILLNDSFSTIQKAVEWGRGIYENFQRFIQFQLTVNLVAVLTVVICELQGKEIPFTTIQLLWVNLIMDGPPALSLGLESLRKHLMDKRPVRREESIISRNMLSRIIANGLFIVILMMLVVNNQILGGTAEQQTSIIFTTFVLFQLFNAFNSRELENDSIFANLKQNKAMLWIIGGTFLLQIVITQFGGEVFRTASLPFSMWVKIILYSSSVVFFSEGIRFVKRVWKKVTSPSYA